MGVGKGLGQRGGLRQGARLGVVRPGEARPGAGLFWPRPAWMDFSAWLVLGDAPPSSSEWSVAGRVPGLPPRGPSPGPSLGSLQLPRSALSQHAQLWQLSSCLFSLKHGWILFIQKRFRGRSWEGAAGPPWKTGAAVGSGTGTVTGDVGDRMLPQLCPRVLDREGEGPCLSAAFLGQDWPCHTRRRAVEPLSSGLLHGRFRATRCVPGPARGPQGPAPDAQAGSQGPPPGPEAGPLGGGGEKVLHRGVGVGV